MRAPRALRSALLALAVLLAPRVALAHTDAGTAAGFLSGFRHPISGWDHILAMIAVGLWGAQLGPPALWLLPVIFPMMMAVGGVLGLLGVALPGVEVGIAASAIVLGLMIALEAKPKLSVAIAIVALFALFHGHAHGAEVAPGTSPIAYSLGFVVSTGCLHGIGILLGTVHARPAGRRVVQTAGGLVAAAGLLFLWRAVV